LIRLLDEGLSELVAPSGLLVLSGIIDKQIGDVEAAVQRNSLTKVGYKNMGDWVVMCFTH
jgi:ribosomal protein L11 methylase PrmA